MKFSVTTKIIGCVIFASLSACGKVKPNTTVANADHVFEACKGDVRQQGVIYDEANARAEISYRKGNKTESCKHRRDALAAMTRSLESFQSGKCRNFHEVASGYVSFKVKNLQTRLAGRRDATAALVKRDCS